MVTFSVNGSYNKTKKYLKKVQKADLDSILEKYGEKGVKALSEATPKDTGKTAASWKYEIKKGPNGPTIYWINTNRVNGVLIALILQYGHGTRRGGYVKGRDYINPAIRPIFDEFAKSVCKEIEEL